MLRVALLRYIMQIVMNIKVLCVPEKDVVNNLCGPIFSSVVFFTLFEVSTVAHVFYGFSFIWCNMQQGYNLTQLL